jgi:hypothetical protein
MQKELCPMALTKEHSVKPVQENGESVMTSGFGTFFVRF